MAIKQMLIGSLLLALPAFSSPTWSQDYPVKPVRIVVPVPPGGANDNLARVVAEKLSEKLGQPFIIENRAGASGNIGSEMVFRSPPDGYTLLVCTPGPLVTNKALFAKLSYDPNAFVPVSVVVTSPNLLVVRPGVPANTVAELLAYAKANPDKLNYASQGVGTGAHLTSELLKMTTGARIVHVAYKGTAPALTDLLGGQMDIMFIALGDVLQHVRTGKLRALAVGTIQRNPRLPELPSISETLPGFVSAFWQGVVASPGTPSAIASRLSAAIAEGIAEPATSRRLAEMSMDVVGSTPIEMTKLLAEERERWGKVIRSLGLKME